MSAHRKNHLRSKMPPCCLLIGLVFVLVHFGYAFGQPGHGEEKVVGPTLLIISGLVGILFSRWIRGRSVAMDR